MSDGSANTVPWLTLQRARMREQLTLQWRLTMPRKSGITIRLTANEVNDLL